VITPSNRFIIKVNCQFCGKEFLWYSKNRNCKTGPRGKYCSLKCAYNTEVAEKMIGRPLAKNEVVHHL